MVTQCVPRLPLGERVAQLPEPPATVGISVPGRVGYITQRKPWVAKLQLRPVGLHVQGPPHLPLSDENSLF